MHGMEATSRHQLIVERLRRDGTVSVADLADQFETSGVTIRRDLDELERLGVLRRTRGGAENLLLRSEEMPYRFRANLAAAAKQRIAAAASSLIRDGEVVAVDSGTTGLAAARALAGRSLTVMPLSVQEIQVLADSPTVRMLMPGGEARPGEGSVVGPVAERTLSAYRFDTFLMTCCGVSAQAGVTAFDVQDAAVKQQAARQSARIIALADGSKLSVTAMAQVLDAAEITTLVTDAGASQRRLDELAEAGVEIVRV